MYCSMAHVTVGGCRVSSLPLLGTFSFSLFPSSSHRRPAMCLSVRPHWLDLGHHGGDGINKAASFPVSSSSFLGFGVDRQTFPSF